MAPLAGLPLDATMRKTHVQTKSSMPIKSAVVMPNLFADYNGDTNNKNAAIDNDYNKNSKTILQCNSSYPSTPSADCSPIPVAELSSSNGDDNNNSNSSNSNNSEINDDANNTESEKESVPHLVASRAKTSRHNTPLLHSRSKQQPTHRSQSSAGQSGGTGSNFYFSKSTGGVSGDGGGSSTSNNDLFGGIMGQSSGGNDDDDEEEEEDFVEADSASTSGSSGESSAVSWIYWFCSLPGHEFFIEVPEEFIKDDFNLTGLNTLVLLYNEALDMILDLELDPQPTPAQLSLIESSAEMLYGLIHQRFLLTKGGLGLMSDRLVDADFGACPREGCGGAPVLPCGRSDQPSVDTVKMFCVRCCDLYHPREARFQNIDGAFFGTTFPHLFYNTYPQLIPPVITPIKSASEATAASTTKTEDGGDDNAQPIAPTKLPNYRLYVPRLFGFRLSERSQTGPRMGWLRWKDGVDLGAGDGVIARSMEVGMYRVDENMDEDIFGDD